MDNGRTQRQPRFTAQFRSHSYVRSNVFSYRAESLWYRSRHVPDENEESVLRRYNIGITRIGISSQQTIPVMATGIKDAEAMAVGIAGDRLFSEVDASYEVFASDADSVVIQDGDAVTWVDPEDGPAQPVVFRRTYGDIVLCHTQGGGEVEAFASELR